MRHKSLARYLLLFVLLGVAGAVPAASRLPEWTEPLTGMEFVQVPKGCFRMGLPAGAFADDDAGLHERVRRTEMPAHEVCLESFWIARYEVRQADWQKIMGEVTAPSGALTPMSRATWSQAVEFARRLTQASGGGQLFRLPTEAEWEYACRAGEAPVRRVPDRAVLNSKAWYSSPYDAGFSGNRIGELQPVGTKQANAFGLHDMLGNVWEWVQDGYQANAYSQHRLYSPVIDMPAERRVIRGGSLHTDQRMLRCEARGWLPAELQHGLTGFRLVREVHE